MTETESDSPRPTTWYIVRQASEECLILPAQPFTTSGNSLTASSAESRPTISTGGTAGESSNLDEQLASQETQPTSQQDSNQTWGPFNTKEEAIAKRIGLIRSGKCKPK